MTTAVILLNFGEPERPEPEAVTAFLERIFAANARLEGPADPDAARQRARELATRRSPGLLAEYRAIGGSPLNAQAAAQARALAAELAGRDRRVIVEVGMQFTDPDLPAAVERTRAAGADRLVALPVYPLCGPSTNIAALRALRSAVEAAGWDVPVVELGGWHTHPGYTRLRADGVRRYAERAGLDLGDARTALVFAAHGTPIRYLRDGSRYDTYVLDHCARLAAELGVDGYRIGYQNHDNRPGVEWTSPPLDEVLAGLRSERVVVVPVSFMQEQSETLAELDITVAAAAAERGLEFHRVPVPHDDPAFAAVLADLVEPFTNGGGNGNGAWGRCRCRGAAKALCLTHSVSPPEPAAGPAS